MTTVKMEKRIKRNGEKKYNDMTSAQIVKMHIKDGDMPSLMGQLLLFSERNDLFSVTKDFVKWLLDENASPNLFYDIMQNDNALHYNYPLSNLWNKYLDISDIYLGMTIDAGDKDRWQRGLGNQAWWTQTTIFMLMVAHSLKKKVKGYDKWNHPKWHDIFDKYSMNYWLGQEQIENLLDEYELY